MFLYVLLTQVVDISVQSPESVVRWLPERCRLLVAGGDGTVAWVLNSLTTAPHVKVCPIHFRRAPYPTKKKQPL